ncbi:MAG: response regulator transcription factor [Breznakibacter sp.]
MMSDKLTVILVDDHILFRNGFKLLLQNLPDIDVVGEAANGEEFLDNLSVHDPDLVFLDIAMPVMDGCVAAQKALGRRPHLKIIALSMYGDESYYSQLNEIGVKGFLLKSSDFKEVQMAIEKVAAGGTYISQEIMANILVSQRERKSANYSASQLSEREQEILKEVCNGLSTSEIAEKYCISPRTVEKHRGNILLKTNCKNTASLVLYAYHNGLI